MQQRVSWCHWNVASCWRGQMSGVWSEKHAETYIFWNLQLFKQYNVEPEEGSRCSSRNLVCISHTSGNVRYPNTEDRKTNYICSMTVILLHWQLSCSQSCIASNRQWNRIVVSCSECLFNDTYLRKEFLNHLFHSEYCGGKLYSRQWNKREVIVKRKVVKGGRGVEEVGGEMVRCWNVQVKLVYVTPTPWP